MIVARIKNGSMFFGRVAHRYDPKRTYPHHFTWYENPSNATLLPDQRLTVNSFESLVKNELDSSIIYKLFMNNGEEYDSAKQVWYTNWLGNVELLA